MTERRSSSNPEASGGSTSSIPAGSNHGPATALIAQPLT